MCPRQNIPLVARPTRFRRGGHLSPDLPLDTGDSRNLRAVTLGPRLVWTLELAGRDLKAYVAVSALDAAWNESGLSEAVPIRGR